MVLELVDSVLGRVGHDFAVAVALVAVRVVFVGFGRPADVALLIVLLVR